MWDNINAITSVSFVQATYFVCCVLTINLSIWMLKIAYVSKCTSEQLQILLRCCLLKVFHHYVGLHPESCYSTMLSIDEVNCIVDKYRRNGDHSQPQQNRNHIESKSALLK